MKLLVAFSVFIFLHLAGWAAAHVWMNNNQRVELVVVDTSYSMKPQFDKMQDWLTEHAGTVRYTKLVVGTDKEVIGDYDTVRSPDSLFRTAFGKFSSASLARYGVVDADSKILLSDGSIKPGGWQVVEFN